MPCTGLKCLNANFICCATQLLGGLRGGGGLIQNLIFFWDDLHSATLTNYCKHFPKSICREFISPTGLFFLLPCINEVGIKCKSASMERSKDINRKVHQFHHHPQFHMALEQASIDKWFSDIFHHDCVPKTSTRSASFSQYHLLLLLLFNIYVKDT